MPRTIVITGTSSGFGKLRVERFAAEGWNVVATVRKNTDPTAHLSKPRKAVILWHSLLECLLALVLLFGATTFVRWVVGPSPISSAIPTVRVRLLIIGAAVGVLLFGLILSPAGRASGGHVNPAITLTMWASGAFPGAAVTCVRHNSGCLEGPAG